MGFVFEPIQCVLYCDFGMVEKIEKVIRIISNPLITNAQQYVSLLGGKVDALVDDVCQFFKS